VPAVVAQAHPDAVASLTEAAQMVPEAEWAVINPDEIVAHQTGRIARKGWPVNRRIQRSDRSARSAALTPSTPLDEGWVSAAFMNERAASSESPRATSSEPSCANSAAR